MSIINWNERKLAKQLYEVKFYNDKQSLNEAKHILKNCGGLDLTYQAVKYAKTNMDSRGKVTPTTIYAACKDIGDKELFELANSYYYTGKGVDAKDLKFWESDEKKIYKALEKNDLTGVERILSNLKKSELDFTAKVGSHTIYDCGEACKKPIILIDQILKHYDKISSILSLFDKCNIEFDNVEMSCKKLEVEPLGKVKTDIIKPAEYSLIKIRKYEIVSNLIDRRLKNKEDILHSLEDSSKLESFLSPIILYDNEKLFNYLTGMVERSVKPELNGDYVDSSLIIAIKEKAKTKPKVKPEPVSKYIKESDHIVSISEKLEDTGETLTTKFNFKSDTARYVVNNKTLGILSFKDYTDEQTIIEASKFLQDNGGDITDWSARNGKKTDVSKVLIVDLKNKGCN